MVLRLLSLAMLFIVTATPVWAVDAEFQEWLMTELIDATPGQVIELPAGRYSLDSSLSLNVDSVTLRGHGANATVLSFKEQTEGAEGLIVSGNRIVLEGFAIEDTKGDGIKVMRADSIVMRGLRVEWTSHVPSATNGAYGLYPVQSRGVLIEDCRVIGASDAGIYVGQSEDIIVRRNTAFHNVAGIEIENSKRADVYANHAFDNTAGILVFNLPDLAVFGQGVRVYDNEVSHNNTNNFAPPANVVGGVPTGTGIMIMAHRGAEVFHNKIADNQTAGLLLVSYFATGKTTHDQRYNPFVEAIFAYENHFGNNGSSPKGGSSDESQQLIAALVELAGVPFPNVIFDGATSSPDGGVEPQQRICVEAKSADSFINIDLLGGFERLSRDLGPYQCELPHLPPVEIK